MSRHDGRNFDEIRPVSIELGFLKYPHGSALISCGNTRVLCTVQIEEKVPRFIEDRPIPQGWLTAEYALMPASGLTRNPRAGYGRTTVKGRVHEIQRLIGRSMRCAIDLTKIGQRTIMIDCDVLQADGGTRTASITGAMVALEMAVKKLMDEGKITENPIINRIAAISIGIVDGKTHLDLDYPEDSTAETDLNLVMSRDDGFVEIQGTAEHGTYNRSQLNEMINYGEEGIRKLFEIQDKALETLK